VNLGNIAGGIAKGYQEAEDLKLRKRQQAQSDARFKHEQDSWADQDLDTARAAAVATPGKSVPVNYDPSVDVDAVKAAAQPATTSPHSVTSMIGAVAHALRGNRTQEAAQAAGVLPPPPVSDPNAARAPAKDGEVEPVVVAPGKQTREADLVDYYRGLAYVASKSKQTPIAQKMAAFKQYTDELHKDASAKLMSLDPADMANGLSRATGKVVTAHQNDDGSFEVSFDGEDQKFKNREEMVKQLQPMLDQDPKAFVTYAENARKEWRDNQRIKAEATQAYASLVNAGASATRASIEGKQFSLTVDNQRQALGAAAFLRDPENRLKDPKGWAAAQGTLDALSPRTTGDSQSVTDEAGNITRTARSRFDQAADEWQQRIYNTSDQKAYILPVQMSDGSSAWAIKNPNGGPSIIAPTFAQAEMQSRSLWGHPTSKSGSAPTGGSKPTKPAIPAPQGM
jgi:hypothetical protein